MRRRPSSLLDLEDISVAYPQGDGLESVVLDGLSVSLGPSDTMAVIGPSGEGKTTLLKVMAGLLVPRRGRRTFTGEGTAIGMAFQRGGLFDSMSVAENLLFPLREARRGRGVEAKARVEAALAEVGLEGQGELAIADLSGGMQKRLGIARALILRPALVLLDEPTAGLDPITARSIVDLLVEVREKHRLALVLVTSDPAVALRCADLVGFLWRGNFRALARAEEIGATTDPAVRQFLDGALEGPLT